MKIFDVHTHIYPDTLAEKAVQNIGRFYGVESMPQGGKISDLLFEAQEFDVQKIVVCSVATKAQQVYSINNFMASQSSQPKFLPLATLHPDMDRTELINEVERIKTLGLKGVKLHPDCQAFKLNGESGRKIFDALADSNLPVLVHTGDKRHDLSHPDYMLEIARDYPSITFIAAHFGGWSEWEQTMKYKGQKNIMFDTSSTLAFLNKQLAKDLILGLGADKFMFGTDFPMWRYDTEIQRVLDLNLGEENNESVFRLNAEKFFGVSI